MAQKARIAKVPEAGGKAGTWTAVTGYLGVGFAGTPTSQGLQVNGPNANVQLCVADAALQPSSIE